MRGLEQLSLQERVCITINKFYKVLSMFSFVLSIFPIGKFDNVLLVRHFSILSLLGILEC